MSRCLYGCLCNRTWRADVHDVFKYFVFWLNAKKMRLEVWKISGVNNSIWKQNYKVSICQISSSSVEYGRLYLWLTFYDLVHPVFYFNIFKYCLIERKFFKPSLTTVDIGTLKKNYLYYLVHVRSFWNVDSHITKAAERVNKQTVDQLFYCCICYFLTKIITNRLTNKFNSYQLVE